MSETPEIKSPQDRGQRPPPVEKQFHMRIARDGTWFHEGGEIRRIELAKLFSTVLKRDESGDYWLETPVERGRIDVEDVPFIVVEMSAKGEGREQEIAFRTNLDEWVTASSDHPIRLEENPETGEPSPYILIRDRLEARISRSVYYELVGIATAADVQTAEGTEVGVWSGRQFFVLGRLG